jgi:hypothetical protein
MILTWSTLSDIQQPISFGDAAKRHIFPKSLLGSDLFLTRQVIHFSWNRLADGGTGPRHLR